MSLLQGQLSALGILTHTFDVTAAHKLGNQEGLALVLAKSKTITIWRWEPGCPMA